MTDECSGDDADPCVHVSQYNKTLGPSRAIVTVLTWLIIANQGKIGLQIDPLIGQRIPTI